ncbi:hypothetical protein ABG067_001243 [Albugo candida]
MNSPYVEVIRGSCPGHVSMVCPPQTTHCERVKITLTGRNFGRQKDTWSLQLVPSSPNSSVLETIDIFEKDVILFNHNIIQFYLPPGQGAERYLRLIISKQPALGPDILFSYEAPKLLALSTDTDNLTTCGGFFISLYGKNFGTRRSKVLIGGSEARVDMKSSHPLACEADACQYSTSGPCLDAENLVCYPSEYDVLPRFAFKESCSSPDFQRLCASPNSADLSDPNAMESFDFHSDYLIRTKVPPGLGKDIPVYVIVDNVSSNSLRFTFNQPVIDSQIPNLADANSANTVEIRGSDFGCFPNRAITLGFLESAGESTVGNRRLSRQDSSDTAALYRKKRRLAASNTSVTNGNVTWKSANTLMWKTPKIQAGITNLVLDVGGNLLAAKSQTEIRFQCSAGYYKTEVRFCEVCPPIARCNGGDSPPQAEAGYWREGEYIFGCDPLDACLGRNVCVSVKKATID